MPRQPRILLALALALGLSCVTARAARQDGLVVYLTFDDENEPLKNSAPAPSGREPVSAARIGEAIEPKFTAGKYGKAALFRSKPIGSNHWSDPGKPFMTKDWAISLGNLDDVYAGSFTVSAWVNLAATTPGVIIGNKESFNIASGWALTSSLGKNYLVNALGGPAQTTGTRAFDKGWHNLVFVVNRAAGTADHYVDGKKTGSVKFSSADARLGEGLPTVIGAAAKGAYGSQCIVDEVGIWNRALTEAEVVSMGAGKRIPEPATYALLGAGAAGAAALVRRRRRRSV